MTLLIVYDMTDRLGSGFLWWPTEFRGPAHVVGVKMKNYYEYDPDRSLPYGYDTPAGVPKDYDELHREYGKFVVETLRRHNKVDRNATDLLQAIWLHLLKVRFLEKFRESAARRLPLSMTGGEAAKFLGLRWQQWTWFVNNHEHGKMVDPVEGDRDAFHAVWLTADICDFDYEVFSKKRQKKGSIARFRPPMTAWGFKTYLQKSVHNAFANLCRTRARRHKEHVLTPDTTLSPLGDGSYKQHSSGIDTLFSWESNIAAAMTDEEGLVDLIMCFRKLDIDMNGPEGVEILDHMVQQGRKEGGPERNIKLLDFLTQGYTLTEALRKVQVDTRIKAQVHH